MPVESIRFERLSSIGPLKRVLRVQKNTASSNENGFPMISLARITRIYRLSFFLPPPPNFVEYIKGEETFDDKWKVTRVTKK